LGGTYTLDFFCKSSSSLLSESSLSSYLKETIKQTIKNKQEKQEKQHMMIKIYSIIPFILNSNLDSSNLVQKFESVDETKLQVFK